MAALQQQQHASTSPQLRVQRATSINGSSNTAQYAASNKATTNATGTATAGASSNSVVSSAATRKADAAMSHRLAKYMAAAEQEGWGQYNSSSERDNSSR
jgi:hypothetical protein